jgi:hypothetical protein
MDIWSNSLDGYKLIDELRDLEICRLSMSGMANILLNNDGNLRCTIEKIFLELNPGEKAMQDAGITVEEANETMHKAKAAFDRAKEWHSTPHSIAYLDKTTFLNVCAQVFDQKEHEYVTQEDCEGMGFTSADVRKYLAHVKAAETRRKKKAAEQPEKLKEQC